MVVAQIPRSLIDRNRSACLHEGLQPSDSDRCFYVGNILYPTLAIRRVKHLPEAYLTAVRARL